MPDFRLGDVIDDFCVKCRRVTNHSIVSLLKGDAAKVRCRTCYSDHDYRHEQAPPSKKELQRQKDLYNAVLAGIAPPPVAPGAAAAEAAADPSVAMDPSAAPLVPPVTAIEDPPPVAAPGAGKKAKKTAKS
jgi:hypothetical protein